MGNILDKYGIKEVADVTIYELNEGSVGKPVLYLDTLKVSTIEQTAEEATANGGKGNAPLIIWDYGKEINVTLEDALFSAKSMAVMFGDSEVTTTTASTLLKTIPYVPDADTSSAPTSVPWQGPDGKMHYATGGTLYTIDAGTMTAVPTTGASLKKGNTYYYTYSASIKDYGEIEISANSFPGTYYITGDTYARSEKDGKDEFFQFIIPKAKVQSSQTITLSAEGDPSVFNLNLRVLRPAGGGAMMKLVKYDV